MARREQQPDVGAPIGLGMASDVVTNDQAAEAGGLAQLFITADAAIERRRCAGHAGRWAMIVGCAA